MGLTYSSYTSILQVNLVSRRSCSKDWGARVLAGQVCAVGAEQGAAVCEGGSGGPILTKNDGVWEQGGVVSSGSAICGDPKPAFFTIITQPIKKWIEANMVDKLLKRPS